MKHFHTFIIFLFISVFVQAQKITKLFEDKNYKELITYEKEESHFTAEETYYLGYSFFQMENDKKAVLYYDKAIEKGFEDPIIYFQKGLALMFDKQLDEALKYYNIAISKAQVPSFYLEKARIYKLQNKNDLEINTYVEGIKNTQNDDRFYAELVKNAGNYYYAETREYGKAIEIYKTALEKMPPDFKIYEKLIKALNADKKFNDANSYFLKAKSLYDQKQVSQDILKFKNMAVDEFEWNGQWLNVFKSFETPKENLDILYAVYLIDKSGEKIERKFNIEKTLQLDKKIDPEFVVCEEIKNGHATFPIGFKDDSFTVEELENLIKNLLDKSVKPSASIIKGN